MLHKSCCLITGYHFPGGSHCHSFNSSLFHLLFLSPIPVFSLTCFLLLYFLFSILLSNPYACSSFLLRSYPLSPSLPSVLVSSFLLGRLLSEMAAGSSVAQLGINKHLDISLLSPSPVALFFSFHFSPRTRTTQAFLPPL